MHAPCCLGVVRNPDALQGHSKDLKGMEIYETTPRDHKNGAGVVVMHDIFGFGIPNTKFIVDFLASHGFHAIMGDTFHGDPWSSSGGFGDEFQSWLATKTTPEAWSKLSQDVGSMVEYLESKGISKIGVIGFCYGGKAATNESTTGRFGAAVSIHGFGHGAADIASAKCPILYVVPRGDPYFKDEQIEEVTKAINGDEKKGDIKVYEGVTHGWTVRADYTDEKIKASADAALGDVAKFLKKHLVE